jgi:hypothetical protein
MKRIFFIGDVVNSQFGMVQCSAALGLNLFLRDFL